MSKAYMSSSRKALSSVQNNQGKFSHHHTKTLTLGTTLPDSSNMSLTSKNIA
jgi:hypothetical protein